MILVTGGAGFIGSNILAGLEAAGAGPLVCCDWLGEGDKWRNIAGRALHDFVFPENLFEYLDLNGGEIKAVVHMGAISSTVETDADLIVNSNFILSRRLFDWCAENGVPFIYASSAATYGDGEAGFDDRTPIDALKPLNAYGWSKHVFDRFVQSRGKTGGAMPPQVAGLKFFNVYGPNEYHKGGQMSVVCGLYPKIMAGEAARLFKSYRDGIGDGQQARDFVYVDDCVNVVSWLLENPKVSGLFNVGSGKARTFLDLAKATFEAAGRQAKIEFIDMPETLRPKYQYFTQGNIDALRAAGYNRPATTLEDGIGSFVTRYMAHADKYR